MLSKVVINIVPEIVIALRPLQPSGFFAGDKLAAIAQAWRAHRNAGLLLKMVRQLRLEPPHVELAGDLEVLRTQALAVRRHALIAIGGALLGCKGEQQGAEQVMADYAQMRLTARNIASFLSPRLAHGLYAML